MVMPKDSDQAIDLNDEPDSSIPCSICLDLMSYGGERSTAKLQCGHEFHLDCIGSAFNSKGMMQCPNCRKIEKGRWLYANSPTNSSLELSMDDGAIDSYPLYLSFAEMPYRVHICPFHGLTPVLPSSGSSLGMMSAITPMMTHQHPGSSPHPHGWIHFQHSPPPFHHHQQSSGMPIPVSGVAGRFDAPRSVPRFIPPGRVYDPNATTFSLYPENPSLSYLHAWGQDNVPHFP